MKQRYLTLAIAACVAGVAITAPTQAFRTDTPAAAEVSAPTTTQPRFLALDEVPATLASTGGNPAAWTTPATLQGKTYTEAAQSRVPLVAWVESRALADPSLRNDVRDMLASGLPVLVTSSDGQERHEMETFGFEGSGRNTIYRREPNGTLRAVSTSVDASSGDGADAWLRTTKAVMETTAPATTKDSLRTFSTFAANDSTEADDVPILTIFDQVIAEKGRSATQTITVIRDTSASRDDKVVIVKTQLDVVPEQNGVSTLVKTNNIYRPNGEDFIIAFPDSYHAATVLSWGTNTSPNVRLTDRIPRSDGSTDRKITESIQSKTSFGLSTSPDVTRTLAKESITTAGKLPVSVSFGKERTETTGVEFTVKDYSTQSLTRQHSKGIAAEWDFPLANDIRANREYFKKGRTFHSSTSKFTPMMRRASLETVSTWRIAGADEQTIRIGSRGTTTTRRVAIADKKFDLLDGDISSIELTRDSGGLPLPISQLGVIARGFYNALASVQNPWVITKVDLSSPYLTRSPTVLIQSLSGSGQCLTSQAVASSPVVLARCDAGVSNKAQQWNLEADDTYRNRANGQCLTANPGDGTITMSTCARLLNQQWKWSADRIHSQYQGGERWRLHVRNGTLNATFDPSRHQVMVSNQYHALLRPWSSYPGAPSPGDVIPNPAGASPPVPMSYFNFGPVSNDQRWQTLPLRQGL